MITRVPRLQTSVPNRDATGGRGGIRGVIILGDIRVGNDIREVRPTLGLRVREAKDEIFGHVMIDVHARVVTVVAAIRPCVPVTHEAWGRQNFSRAP